MDTLEKWAKITREKKYLKQIFLFSSAFLVVLFYGLKSDAIFLQPFTPIMACAVLILILDLFVSPIKNLAESDLPKGEKFIGMAHGQQSSISPDSIDYEYMLSDRRIIVRSIFGVDWYDLKDIQKIDAPNSQFLSSEKNVKIVFCKGSPSERKLQTSNHIDRIFFGDAFSIKQNEADSFYKNLQQAVAKAKK